MTKGEKALNSYSFVTKKIARFCAKISRYRHTQVLYTLGQKATFCPEITKNLMFEECEFCEKRALENVNFVKIETLKMRIL